MRELAGRLAALDPDAGASLQVITYFDQLVERRAGLESVVRGAAVLSGHPAVLIDTDRDLHLRIAPDGVRSSGAGVPEPGWCHVAADTVTVWLERPAPAGPVEAMVLERAAMAARIMLDRTRSRRQPRRRRDAELIEVLLDATAPEPDRLRAAHLLGLPANARAQVVVAALGGRLAIDVQGPNPQGTGPAIPAGERCGVGPAVLPLDLPGTVAVARAAARFTAEGGPSDPGPRRVQAEDLGGLLLLAQSVDAHTPPVPDVVALEKAAATAPWMLVTLDAVATHASLRAAAVALHLHHSTLQERLAHAERLLGWSLHDVTGHLRLSVALLLRRLHRNHPAPPAAGNTAPA